MKSVAILGPGLLGGSIALALREDPETNVRLWARRTEALEEARGLAVADLVTGSVEEAVEGAAECLQTAMIPLAPSRGVVGSLRESRSSLASSCSGSV